ncbi:hypothetical protein, partial [uncultured Eudoraea sp.]|uniref:hypothetical protein n=1 Tax=uncultured Eudoraea sp. TaxID=1035614 RepID=UPI002619E2F8
SETIVTGAGINVVTGTGTTGDPYIITATEVDGSVTNEVNTVFAVNAGNLEITDSDGTLSVPLASLGTDDQNIDVLTLNGATNILTVGIENGSDLTVDLSSLSDTETITTMTGTAGSGNAIGTYTNEASTPVVINETVTTLSQDNATGVITYTNESATAQTADVISTDADNQITAGSDGGAYLNLPVIYSAGKVNGNGTAASIYQATVSRINEGDYQITFTTALSNANYIIQLATIDCNGDCPGNTSANYDDPGITYYDQQTSGFKINIGDSDNGTTSKDDIDLEFMYTVIKLP